MDHHIQVEPAPAEVLRLLGYREGSTQLTKGMLQILEEVNDRGRKLLTIRAATEICGEPSAFGAPELFKNAEKLVLGIVTIGSAVEEQAERYIQEKEWTRALVLDAYGSAAVEAAVVELNYKICKHFEESALVAGRRVSPGYPKWPVEQQKLLFDAFKTPRPAGVELNEYFIMTPRKSVSFGVPLGANLMIQSPELGCRFCNMRNCEFRREPAAPQEEGRT